MLKRCPQCGREYFGEDSFCLDDGTLLLSGPSHSVGVSGDQPTQLVSRNVPSPALSPARWPFVLIGLLVVVVAALAGALFTRQANGPDDKKTETTDTETVTRPLASPLTVASPVTAASPVQSVPPRPPISPAGQWKGDWSTSSGAYYKFDLALNESDGHVDGQITWTLVRTTRPDKMGMQGMSATEYVRGELLARRADGAAILLISEDLDELLALSDRLLVLYEGRVMATLPADGADPEHLGLLMAGREAAA